MSESYTIFDRALVRTRQKKREGSQMEVMYLFKTGAEQLLDRLGDFNRDFKDVLAIGMTVDPTLFKKAPKAITSLKAGELDEEHLVLPEKKYDLILSNLTLHWVNDLPGALIQMNRALKPDGLFLGVLFGEETLKELRYSLLVAETEVSRGASPRVSPFVDIRDAGNLLARAGFALPVADVDKLTVSYETPFHLFNDLRAMGEANALLERKKTFTPRGVFKRAAAIYAAEFSGADGKIPASFHFLHLSGFAPSPDQPKPLKPGSGKVDLRDVFQKKP